MLPLLQKFVEVSRKFWPEAEIFVTFSLEVDSKI